MKKGIILLITLFFIAAISVLILQNLEDSEKFLRESSLDTDLAQFKITHTNVQKEIIKTLNNNKGAIEKELEEAVVLPLQYGDILLTIELQQVYEESLCNINNLKKRADIVKYCGEDIGYALANTTLFIENLTPYLPITSQSQLDYFLDEYIQQSNDEQIEKVQHFFGYRQIDSTQAQYIRCDYSVSLATARVGYGEFLFKVGDTTAIDSYFIVE